MSYNMYKIVKVNMLKQFVPGILSNKESVSFDYSGNGDGTVVITTNVDTIVQYTVNNEYYSVTYNGKTELDADDEYKYQYSYTIVPVKTMQVSTIQDTIVFSYTFNQQTVSTSVNVQTAALPSENMTVSTNTISITDEELSNIGFTVNSIYPITVSTSDTSGYLGTVQITNNDSVVTNGITKTVTIYLNTALAANNNSTITIESGEGYLTTVSTATISFTAQFKSWYGVQFSGADTVGTRIGDLNSHNTLPIQSKMRGCTITSDGVVKYLNTNDWTKYEDGTDRNYSLNTMVEIPEFYSYTQETSNGFVIKISDSVYYETNMDGEQISWYHHEKCYVSAYEAFIYQEDSEDVLVSRANQYPSISTTRDRFQTLARANGSEHWNMYTYEAHKAICWLYLVEYANRNSQADYNANLTTEGYKQGGLGAGVTTGTGSTHSYNYTVCGVTDSLGNNTGIVSNTTEGITANVPRYRGIENPFGSLWKNVIDIKIISDSVYQCKDYNNFSSTNDTNNYDLLTTTYTSNKYSYKKMNVSVVNVELFETNTSTAGSATTYWCDYYYSSSSSTPRTLLLGSGAGGGTGAGLFGLGCDNALGYSGSAVGTRLTYLI